MFGGTYKYDDTNKILHVYPSDNYDPYVCQDNRHAIVYCEKIVVYEGVRHLCSRQFAYAMNCRQLILPESLIFIGDKCFVTAPIEHVKVPENANVGFCAFRLAKSIEWKTIWITDVLNAIGTSTDVVLWTFDSKASIRLATHARDFGFDNLMIGQFGIQLGKEIEKQVRDYGYMTNYIWLFMQMFLDICRAVDCRFDFSCDTARHLLSFPGGISDEDYMGVIRLAGFTPETLDVINAVGKPQMAAWFMEQCKGKNLATNFDL